ncbi:hypothetical protein ACLQ24_27290 [Micromonospora sp. DT4]|uniref:hypothetical protein n=1 Tax=Micromonospora sp. DT4 TaxID=3393438 RepID=UPI003CEEEEA4
MAAKTPVTQKPHSPPKQAVWSKNVAVKFSWFDNVKVTGATTLANVTAYDADGKRIGQVPGERHRPAVGHSVTAE